MGSPKLISFPLVSLFFILATIIPAMEANADEWDELRKYFKGERKLHKFQCHLTSTNESDLNKNKISISTINDHYLNSTRRELYGKKNRRGGPCMATNVIDQCWRCDPNWAKKRQNMADCVKGFGSKARGGKGGKYYLVTDPSDDWQNPKPGTLRHAVIQKEPLWITFAGKMNIKLGQELIMQSDKTIDGRGASVHISGGAGITIQFVKNIIITNIHIHNIVPTSGGMIRDAVDHVGLRTHNEGDGISIFGSTDIWIDHVSMSRCSDGLIDAVQGSSGITISNCHFTDHDKVLLFGASDSTEVDRDMKVTVAFNHFGKRLIERMPRCRSGFFHLVNNDYTHWEMYAIGGSHAPTIISQGNRYIAPVTEKFESLREVTHRDNAPESEWSKWTWVTDGDLFQNGAKFVPSGNPNGAKLYAALELIRPAPASQVAVLTKDAGFLRCAVGNPC
ncbi:OLC1v1009490C1 [Oldenlandia corymbosa var. corymbosa]|uniref:Pectate lyase n=1 Tax=Oldenlandia corymbosa var. corymbosa TaxID=529605 RepID=A0AAV1DP29_OLDCO|nr:OLC1v1009490C1 [Oldenlandia corymbosa var. corymbosa]